MKTKTVLLAFASLAFLSSASMANDRYITNFNDNLDAPGSVVPLKMGLGGPMGVPFAGKPNGHPPCVKKS